jgi:hypothetical protein
MTTTLRIAVPAGTVADAAATGVAATEAVRAIGRIMRGRECRVEIDVAGAAPTLALELDGTNVPCPPILASQIASVTAGEPQVPYRAPADSLVAASAAPESFLVELARAVATGMPRAVFGERAWSTWIRLRDQQIDLVVSAPLFKLFTRLLPQGQIPVLRDWLSTCLGLAPAMRLLPDDTLPDGTYAVSLGGVRLPAHRFLFEECIAVGGSAARLLEQGAKPTTLPWTLREALLIDEAAVADATAEQWWRWHEVWAGTVYSDVRRHADWLVDDGYTDDYLRAVATMLPETARVAYSTVGPRCTEVLGRLLADDVWIGRSETIVAALIEAPEEGGHESDERAVRSQLARGFMNPHLEGGRLPCWSLAGAAVTDVAALVAAARAAVDAIPGTETVPVLLVRDDERSRVASAMRFSVPEIRVLAFGEIPVGVVIDDVGGFPRSLPDLSVAR